MEQTIGAVEARRSFGKVLQDVIRGDAVVVEKNGTPVAAIVPIARYKRWKQRREAFFDEMQAIAERVNLPEAEAEQLVGEAIAAVRAKQRTPDETSTSA